MKVTENSARRFGLEISAPSGQVDHLIWQLADWPDHEQKIADDSGWWVRRVGGAVIRIIVLNAEEVVAHSDGETIKGVTT